MLIIRTARPEDLAVIVEYNQRLAQETEGKALSQQTLERGVQAVLADPERATYYLAELEGQVVGQLMITREWSDWRNGWLWWIQSVYVQQAHRRSGVFKALYQHVLAEGRRRGDVAGVRLYVEKHNTAARATYNRLGMSDAGYLVLELCPLGPES
jgi:GNAT superfamily N-acetyltransferase